MMVLQKILVNIIPRANEPGNAHDQSDSSEHQEEKEGDQTASVVTNQTSHPQVVEELITIMHADKVKKGTSSAWGSSLASLHD